MKNILKSLSVMLAILPALATHANTIKQDTTKKLSTKVKTSVTKVAHKTSQVAASGAAAVVDKTYAGKSGPNGETVYINKNDHYYYINSTGHKVFITKSQMHDKPTQ